MARCRAAVLAALWLRSAGLDAGPGGNGTGPCAAGLAQKTHLSKEEYPQAQCLDGTQGAYYFRGGSGDGIRKFYIYRSGGGFCGSYWQCWARTWTPKGTAESALYTTCKDLQGGHIGFARDPETNPLLHNWNHVEMIYCDGMYYLGKNPDPKESTVIFGGAFIMEGVIADLSKRFGMSQATEIIVGGCSAGGVSTIVTLDWLKTLVLAEAPGASVTGFAFSGYFLNYNFPATKFRDGKKFPYEEGHMRDLLPSACIAAHKGEEHACLVPQVVAPYVKTPLFLWDTLYDKYALKNYLEEPDCGDTVCAGLHGVRLHDSVRKLVGENKNVGAFVSACVHHCDDAKPGGDVGSIAIGGATPMAAHAAWYARAGGPIWIEDPKEKPYSSENAECKASPSRRGRVRSAARVLKALLLQR